MKIRKTAMALLSAFALLGCRHWDVTAPPQTSAGQQPVVQPTSSVVVPVTIKTADLSAAALDEYRAKALVEGETGDLSAKLLVNQPFTAQRAVKLLVSPAVAPVCEIKQIPRLVTNTVKTGVETFSCLIKPWKWGSCSRDVFKQITTTVYDPVKTCTPAVEAQYKDSVEPFIDIKEAIIPTSINVHYSVHLAGLNIEAQGNKLAVSGSLLLNATVDLKQGVLQHDVTVKGALNCDGVVSIATVGSASINPDASVALDLQDFGLNWQKLCIPGAVQAIDLQAHLDPQILIGTKLLGPMLKRIVLKKINDKLQGLAQDKLQFADRLQALAVKLAEPHQVAANTWLTVQPSEIFVSNLIGEGTGPENQLRINAGLLAKPQLAFGDKPNVPSTGTIPFAIDNPSEGFFLALEGSSALSVVRDQLKAEIQKFLAEKYATEPLTMDSVDVYQSGEEVVIALGVAEKNKWFGHLGTIYLTAVPRLSADRSQIEFENVTFDVQTKIVLLKLAAWILDSGIEKKIQDAAHFPLTGPISDATKRFADILIDTPAGSLHAKVLSVEPKGIWIADGRINVLASASGSAALELHAGGLIGH